MSRTKEADLIEPAIALISVFGDNELGLDVTVLAAKLRGLVKPTTEDLVILAGRKDDRLSQVIRNLVSHRTLEKKGLARYVNSSSSARGRYVLTSLGKASVKASWVKRLKSVQLSK